MGERSSNFCWNLRKDSCTMTGTMQNNYLWSGTKVILMNIANASAFCFWCHRCGSMLQPSEVVSNAGQPSKIPSQRVLWDNATAGLGPYGCAPSGSVGSVWTQLGVSMMKNHNHLETKMSQEYIRMAFEICRIVETLFQNSTSKWGDVHIGSSLYEYCISFTQCTRLQVADQHLTHANPSCEKDTISGMQHSRWESFVSPELSKTGKDQWSINARGTCAPICGMHILFFVRG